MASGRVKIYLVKFYIDGKWRWMDSSFDKQMAQKVRHALRIRGYSSKLVKVVTRVPLAEKVDFNDIFDAINWG